MQEHVLYIRQLSLFFALLIMPTEHLCLPVPNRMPLLQVLAVQPSSSQLKQNSDLVLKVAALRCDNKKDHPVYVLVKSWVDMLSASFTLKSTYSILNIKSPEQLAKSDVENKLLKNVANTRKTLSKAMRSIEACKTAAGTQQKFAIHVPHPDDSDDNETQPAVAGSESQDAQVPAKKLLMETIPDEFQNLLVNQSFDDHVSHQFAEFTLKIDSLGTVIAETCKEKGGRGSESWKAGLEASSSLEDAKAAAQRNLVPVIDGKVLRAKCDEIIQVGGRFVFWEICRCPAVRRDCHEMTQM